MKKILHISTIHPRRDTRIFYRECISLSKNGYEVYLLVADGLGSESIEGVNIIDIGKTTNRIKNFFLSYSLILKQVKAIKPNLVHFHDAELMMVCKVITNKDIPVFYDIHENVAMQILDKKHLNPFARYVFHHIYELIEKFLINSFHLILAEDSYLSIYKLKGKSRWVVLNLPQINGFIDYIKADRSKEKGVFYIGGISNHRGLDTTIEALKILKKRNVDFFMHYVGPKPSIELLNKLDIEPIKDNITFYGRMDLTDGYDISQKCKVGLGVLKPIENYKYSYPTKIFEYMSIKLPVITSNFELYRNVVETYNCGYCINPFSARDLANCIETIFKDKKLSLEMGNNGFDLVTTKFNWQNQEKTLIESYNKVL
jgi:glycosyltransferase involved in cell wall biosynthesis